MKHILFLFIALTISITITAQTTPEYSKAKIHLTEDNNINRLNALGVICHGHHAKGRHFTSDFSQRELRIIEEAGFQIEILIEDVQAHYVAQNEHGHDHREQVDCQNQPVDDIQTPANFHLGSVGGYLNYTEILAELDLMQSLYPNLITLKTPISTTLTTHEAREVHWVRISDNPNMDEANEPEILYNSLTHAREPGGMMQMMFYMWYLLENYESDTEIKYLVDNIEMYFIPCVNPDGYVYNETTNPNGGGLWRKNRRDNGDGTMGVDLNRNFGYSWAYDNTGSSSDPNSNTYRGPSAFSEPETQLVKMFVEAHDIQISLNYHTYTNLLLRPWGHIPDLPEDIEAFDAFGQLMVEQNGYTYGGSEILGYFVNGDSDSYMYGAEQIISFTPEVGNSFWSPTAEIEKDGKDNLLPNLYAARFVLNYGRAKEDDNEDTFTNLNGQLDFTLKKYGYKPGPLTVSLESSDMVMAGNPIPTSLTHLEETNLSFNYELDPNLQDGDEVTFQVRVDNGEHTFLQTFTKVFNTMESAAPILADNGDNMNNWNNSTFWGITNARFYSAPTSIADSPQGDYQAGNTALLQLENSIDLTNALDAHIRFRAEWDIESSYDYCQLQASSETQPFEGLCGVYTTDGSQYQDEGEPIWDGVKIDWVQEKLSLNDFLGQSGVNIRFLLESDNFVQGDGFFFDDFEIIVTNEEGTSTFEYTANDFQVTSFPNPTNEALTIHVSELPQEAILQIHNHLGQLIQQENIQQPKFTIPTHHLPNGMYYYTISNAKTLFATQKFLITN